MNLIMYNFTLSLVYMDLSLGLSILYLEHLFVLLAQSIFHTSSQYMDFVEVFNVSLDFSTIYFAHFSGC